jgi:nucleotide-binding universal stress UspA family protein
MYKRILVPSDGSPLSEAVLLHAQAPAKREGAEIIPLSVPINSTAEFSFSIPFITENLFTKDLSKKTETAGFRVSFLIHKRSNGQYRRPGSGAFTDTGGFDPPAKGGNKK